MTRSDQALIAHEILDGVREFVDSKLPEIPASWDGIEIRQWIADVVADRWAHKMDKQRRREYENDVLVKNLT